MEKMYCKLTKGILFPCLLAITGLTGCTFEEGAVNIETYEIEVLRSDWKWNPSAYRYECLVYCDELTENIYNNGIVDVKVYIIENRVETLNPLPYVQTYQEGHYVYTETVSYDLSPGAILFTVQASDLSDANRYLQTLYFKISMMRD